MAPRRLALLALAAGLAAAIGAAGARLRRGSSAPPAPEIEVYACACGAEYRVSGADRHRVYWRADAPASEPVLGDRCAACGEPLPAGRDVVAH